MLQDWATKFKVEIEERNYNRSLKTIYKKSKKASIFSNSRGLKEKLKMAKISILDEKTCAGIFSTYNTNLDRTLYLFIGWSILLFMELYLIIVKTADMAQIFCRNLHDLRNGLWTVKITKAVLINYWYFLNV